MNITRDQDVNRAMLAGASDKARTWPEGTPLARNELSALVRDVLSWGVVLASLFLAGMLVGEALGAGLLPAPLLGSTLP